MHKGGVGFGKILVQNDETPRAWKQSPKIQIFQSDYHLLYNTYPSFSFQIKFDFSPKFVYNKTKEKQERAPTT